MVIHGAAGAVGSTAVQLARWAGAEVIGTGRSRARQLVMELGADRFIALDTDRLEDAAGQADVVFDLVGGEVLARSAGLLKPGGALISVVSWEFPAGRDAAQRVDRPRQHLLGGVDLAARVEQVVGLRDGAGAARQRAPGGRDARGRAGARRRACPR